MDTKKWEDVTSYSQNDKKRIPKSWRAKLKEVDIIVTRHINYENEDWIIICNLLKINTVSRYKDIDKAKAEAIGIIKSKLYRIIHEIEEYIK